MRGSAATHPPTSAPDGSPQTRRPPAHAGWHTPSHGGGRRRVQHSIQQVTLSAAIAPHAKLSASRASIHVVTQPNVDSKLTRAGLAELALSKNSTEMPVHGLVLLRSRTRPARRLRASRRPAGPLCRSGQQARACAATQHGMSIGASACPTEPATCPSSARTMQRTTYPTHQAPWQLSSATVGTVCSNLPAMYAQGNE